VIKSTYSTYLPTYGRDTTGSATNINMARPSLLPCQFCSLHTRRASCRLPPHHAMRRTLQNHSLCAPCIMPGCPDASMPSQQAALLHAHLFSFCFAAWRTRVASLRGFCWAASYPTFGQTRTSPLQTLSRALHYCGTRLATALPPPPRTAHRVPIPATLPLTFTTCTRCCLPACLPAAAATHPLPSSPRERRNASRTKHGRKR